MTDEERTALLTKAETLLNELFNGHPRSDYAEKRFAWGLVAYDDHTAPGDRASARMRFTGKRGDVLVAANTTDLALVAALFFRAATQLSAALPPEDERKSRDF